MESIKIDYLAGSGSFKLYNLYVDNERVGEAMTMGEMKAWLTNAVDEDYGGSGKYEVFVGDRQKRRKIGEIAVCDNEDELWEQIERTILPYKYSRMTIEITRDGESFFKFASL